jgi:hypothetical protein
MSGINDACLTVKAPVSVFFTATSKPFWDLTGPVNVVFAIIFSFSIVCDA